MSNKILVTDHLFIFDEHVKQLEAAGYEVVRLDKAAATEEELCEAVKGKVGYIMGGVEKITDKVIEAADELKAIVFAGTGYKSYITGHEMATKRGIAIGTAPHLNAHAVAEYNLTMALVMCRDIFGLVRTANNDAVTKQSIADLRVGIVGLGHIGTEFARMVTGLGATNIAYLSRTPKPELEAELNLQPMAKTEFLESCNLICVTLPFDAGEKFFDRDDIAALQPGTIIVSGSEPEQFDLDALYERLAAGEIRVAFDENVREDRYQALPLNVFYAPKESAAYNTWEANEKASTSAVQSLINLIATGDDQFLQNPDYKKAS
jgi:D-3-phosphoglycerate dehydrogenase